MTGVIQRIESRGVIIDLGRAEGVLPPTEQVPKERYRIGQHLKLYTVEVVKGTRIPAIMLSRTNKNLVKRPVRGRGAGDFLRYRGDSIHRPGTGSRSKIAVMARQEGIDPVGACVGVRGARIQTVVNELNNEKIDVILYDDDPARYVANAFSPAEVTAVPLDVTNRRAEVAVPDSMFHWRLEKRDKTRVWRRS